MKEKKCRFLPWRLTEWWWEHKSLVHAGRYMDQKQVDNDT